MKKLPALLCICGVCLGLLLYNIFGVPRQAPRELPDAPTQTSTTTKATTKTADQSPTESLPLSEPEPEEPKRPAVQIRILNEDSARQQAWEEIATQYSQANDVEIVILENAEGASPTLFTTKSLDGLAVQDLSGTVAYAQLADMSLTLTEDGKVCGIASEMNAFGLMYNIDLLISAGYTPGDIYDLNSFAAVVQGLSQQGYTAFAGRGLTDGVAAHLASLPGNIRTLAGLWVANTSTKSEEDALDRFISGESVFYMGSTDEYEAITAGCVKNLGILPIYLDDQPPQSQSLCVTAERYWCVVGNNEAETAAAMAFLDYLVMPDENGVVPMDTLKILAPYRQATYFDNPLEQILRQDLMEGKGYLVCQPVEELPEGFVEALSAYAKDPTDENWNLVEASKNQ